MSQGLHHVELWVPSLERAQRSWGWLFEQLGWTLFQQWDAGRSWKLDDTYVVIEQSPAMTAPTHERLRPGLNHLALHAGTPEQVDRLVQAAPKHGWTLMFADRHPHAGGPDTYAAYLENEDNYQTELVATFPPSK